jgi:hypothetical protein
LRRPPGLLGAAVAGAPRDDGIMLGQIKSCMLPESSHMVAESSPRWTPLRGLDAPNAKVSTKPGQVHARVRTLAHEGLGAREIAECLNAEGFRPAKRSERFGKFGVEKLLQRLGVTGKRYRSRTREGLEDHEWWLPALAQAIGMPTITLYGWARRGWVRTRRQERPSRRWIIWADKQEVEQLRERFQRPDSCHPRRRVFPEPENHPGPTESYAQA